MLGLVEAVTIKEIMFLCLIELIYKTMGISKLVHRKLENSLVE